MRFLLLICGDESAAAHAADGPFAECKEQVGGL